MLRGETLRVRICAHPDAVGLPAAHVSMSALLGTRLTVNGRVLGGLYVTRAPEDEPVHPAEERSHKGGLRHPGAA